MTNYRFTAYTFTSNMANAQHLTVLNAGVDSLNRWRQENAGIIPDLFEADLSGAILSGAHLSGAILVQANLSEANLVQADLRGAYLALADLRKANLSGADLREASLIQAKLTDTNMKWAILN